MATDAQMVAAIKTGLADGAGLVRVTVDGTTTEWDRATAMLELTFYERRAARAAGTRPISASIKLGGL